MTDYYLEFVGEELMYREGVGVIPDKNGDATSGSLDPQSAYGHILLGYAHLMIVADPKANLEIRVRKEEKITPK